MQCTKSKKQVPTLTRNVLPDFSHANDINKNNKFLSSESHSDFHHEIDKLNNQKVIDFLSILANVTQVVGNLFQMKSNVLLSHQVQHSILHNKSEEVHHALADHHPAIEIPIPIQLQ